MGQSDLPAETNNTTLPQADGRAAAGVLAAAILASSNAAMAQGADAGSDPPLVSQLGSTLSDAAKASRAPAMPTPGALKILIHPLDWTDKALAHLGTRLMGLQLPACETGLE